MSFYGKKYKKTRLENSEEFMELLKVPEPTRQMLRNMDSISTFQKNDDGSIQYIVFKAGAEAFNQKITPGVDADFKTPDGSNAKVHFELKGDTLESIITLSNGNKLHLDRIFEDNTMKQIAWKEGLDLKSITYYEVV
ncbi:hypothetical protein MSG28_005717 [Choristoneura fumiferana]|uniref:Uncharacterized protein n=1 Tax=Choristoneura fumiferana TaxID=7141 RepID=A0ACC0KZX3_CHOFU|nr:hypothetical protein MSG28_005717 [Choristoneura fumiferana]